MQERGVSVWTVAYNTKGLHGCLWTSQQSTTTVPRLFSRSSTLTQPLLLHPPLACVCHHMSYIFLESIGFTRNILAFPLCVFLSFSTSTLTVTLSNTAISTSPPPRPADPIVKVYLSASNLVSRLNVTKPSIPSL